jgi:hypothetical protein
MRAEFSRQIDGLRRWLLLLFQAITVDLKQNKTAQGADAAGMKNRGETEER